MENSVLASRRHRPERESDTVHRPLVQAAINRSLSARYEAAADEVGRIIEATYRVIEHTGTVEPTIRDILAEAGLSTQAFYRHFPSKDALLLVLLDDGRRRLTEYLAHRMHKAHDPAAKVRTWIEGVLAQATDHDAAARTRPFLANMARLTEQYPDEQRAAVREMIDLLVTAIADGVARGTISSDTPSGDATAIYHLTISAMQSHVLARSTPPKAETEQVVSFSLRALGVR